MIPALALFAMDRMVHLSAVDIAIVVIYFALVHCNRFLPEALRQNRRRFFPGRPRDDRLGRGP